MGGGKNSATREGILGVARRRDLYIPDAAPPVLVEPVQGRVRAAAVAAVAPFLSSPLLSPASVQRNAVSEKAGRIRIRGKPDGAFGLRLR